LSLLYSFLLLDLDAELVSDFFEFLSLLVVIVKESGGEAFLAGELGADLARLATLEFGTGARQQIQHVALRVIRRLLSVRFFSLDLFDELETFRGSLLSKLNFSSDKSEVSLLHVEFRDHDSKILTQVLPDSFNAGHDLIIGFHRIRIASDSQLRLGCQEIVTDHLLAVLACDFYFDLCDFLDFLNRSWDIIRIIS